MKKVKVTLKEINELKKINIIPNKINEILKIINIISKKIIIILKNTKVIHVSALLIITIVLLTFLGQARSGEEKTVSLTISVASSLKDVMEEIKLYFTKEHPTVNVIFNYGASGSLRQQIEQGAEVDLFISAAAKQMDSLQASGMIIEDTRKNLLGNRLVLVIPEASVTVNTLTDLADDKVKIIAMGEPSSVPVGQYAEEALLNLDLLEVVIPKVVYGKDAKEVLTWVETGNADAGILYETDAIASSQVTIAAIVPEDGYTPIVYPAAVIKNTKQLDAAKEFLNYLYSPKAKSVFEKYGFMYLIKDERF